MDSVTEYNLVLISDKRHFFELNTCTEGQNFITLPYPLIYFFRYPLTHKNSLIKHVYPTKILLF